jgi:hypothetical protein
MKLTGWPFEPVGDVTPCGNGAGDGDPGPT